MPIKVNTDKQTFTLGPGTESLVNGDGVTVSWSGDETNNLSVTYGGQEIGRFQMPKPGTATQVNYEVYVAPIERGEPTTPVRRSVGVERF